MSQAALYSSHIASHHMTSFAHIMNVRSHLPSNNKGSRFICFSNLPTLFPPLHLLLRDASLSEHKQTSHFLLHCFCSLKAPSLLKSWRRCDRRRSPTCAGRPQTSDSVRAQDTVNGTTAVKRTRCSRTCFR